MVLAERRLAMRFPTYVRCRVNVSRNGRIFTHLAMLANISTQGAMLWCEPCLPLGALVAIRFDNFQGSALLARVIRLIEGPNPAFGLALEDGELPFELFAHLAFAVSHPEWLPACIQRLGLAWPCSEQAVKTAYRRLAKKTHPDSGGDHQAFSDLNAAFEEALSLVDRAGD